MNSNINLVSVIIPYFKKKKFIKKTINSVKNQTFKSLEIIIIYDDEDLTDLRYIKQIKKNDKRIKLIINKKNLGAGRSRNLGIRRSNGKYIAFIDADDLWKKNKIKSQLDYMRINKFEISHTSYEILKKKQLKKKILIAKTFNNYKELLSSCDIGLSTVLLKRKIITKYCKFPNLKTKEDFILWLLILKKKITIGGFNQNLTTWRKLDYSLSSSVIQKLKDGFSVYNKYMKFNYLKSLFYLLILSLNSLKK
jgi:teichuronic acid biosynthesis glycosyltransferase TuaG